MEPVLFATPMIQVVAVKRRKTLVLVKSVVQGGFKLMEGSISSPPSGLLMLMARMMGFPPLDYLMGPTDVLSLLPPLLVLGEFLVSASNGLVEDRILA